MQMNLLLNVCQNAKGSAINIFSLIQTMHTSALFKLITGCDMCFIFYRTMLNRARLSHSMLSVCPSVCLSVRDVQVYRDQSHRLEYFENNFTAISLKVYARANSNMGDLVQLFWEHPQIKVE